MDWLNWLIDLIEVIGLIDLIEVIGVIEMIELIELIEDNKVYIYLYTAAKPPAERSEANKSIYLLIHGGEASGQAKQG